MTQWKPGDRVEATLFGADRRGVVTRQRAGGQITFVRWTDTERESWVHTVSLRVAAEPVDN